MVAGAATSSEQDSVCEVHLALLGLFWTTIFPFYTHFVLVVEIPKPSVVSSSVAVRYIYII